MQECASVPPTVARWDANIPPVVLRVSFDDVRSPRDGAARGTSPRRTCWLDLSETYRRGRNCGGTGSWRPPDEAGQSHMTNGPQNPGGETITGGKGGGAGF